MNFKTLPVFELFVHDGVWKILWKSYYDSKIMIFLIQIN